MPRTRILVALIGVALVSLGVSRAPGAELLRAAKLSLGWATVDITPERPAALCGQFALRISQRVEDPLSATALAIEARGESADQAVIVSADIVGIRKRDLERVRELVRPRAPDLDPAKIILATTHTHTAPVLVDLSEEEERRALGQPAPDPYEIFAVFAYRMPQEGVTQPKEYAEFFASRVADAVVEAWRGRKPGAVAWALSYAVVGHNRRARYASGRSTMYGRTDVPDFDTFESTFDPGIELLFTFDAAGKLTGVAVNVACPSQEVEGESYISADFWRDARIELRKRLGEGLFVLPLCGAAGDQSPHLLFRQKAEATIRKRKGGISSREEIGRRIAEAAASGYELAKTDVRAEVTFAHRTELLELPVRKVTAEEYEAAKRGYEEREAKGLENLDSAEFIWRRIYRNIAARYEIQEARPSHPAEVHVLRLGDIAFATNPFELFLDYGLRMKARSPAEQTFVVQLACDCLGYLPTDRAVAGGHYSAEVMSNLIGPEGGRVLVDRTVGLLEALWKD